MINDYLHKAHKVVNGLSLYYAGDVAVIVMDRGENRVNLPLCNAFNALLDDIESNESCKGLITTGKGKFYGNGLDLDLMATLSTEKIVEMLAEFLMLMKRLIFLPIPTLAAINGHAYAAGALFAFAHDLRTMNSQKGWLCLNEVFINRRLGLFNLALLETKIGKGLNFTNAVVLGKKFTGQESLGCGMVHSVQPPEILLPHSLKFLQSFYGKGYLRESLKVMKEDVYRDALVEFEKEIKKKSLEDVPVSKL